MQRYEQVCQRLVLVFVICFLKHVSFTKNVTMNDTTLLQVPRVKPKSGERTFSYNGPKVWNSLPIDVCSSGSIDANSKPTYLFIK